MEKKTTNPYSLWLFRFIRIGFALLIAFAITQLDLSYLEFWTYDLRVRMSSTTEPSGHIATIAIDSRTMETLHGEPTAQQHAMMLQYLAASEPRAVVYVMDMNNLEGSMRDLELLALHTELFPKFYFTTGDIIGKGEESELTLQPPLDRVPSEMALITHDNNTFGKDGVTRRLILTYLNKKMIHAKLAEEFNHLKLEDYKGQFQFLNSTQTYIDFRPAGTYKPLSFYDIYKDNFNPGVFYDKIVLIGRDTMVHASDYRKTPYGRDIVAMSDLEVHANMIDTLILNSSPVEAPRFLNFIFTALISILTVFAVFTLRPITGLSILAATLSSFTIFIYGCFAFFGFWIHAIYPLFAIFICYYFFIPYRLIMENRRSWEYYQHNKLLKQVEELKTNFLRMMSHDLKTPLARIQGMTEIALRDKTPLSEQQRHAIRNISRSSQELTNFVGSILDLSRIESNEVKLHLQSKDINDLLYKVVKKCDYLAKQKNIQILCELDPLFSIQVDPHLLKQVFTNLVENAIKYSPADTKILITSEEADGEVVVQVADQGQGIGAEEVQHVFDRFYRSENAINSPITGSGLGLYLTKYFVELHNGSISVESKVGQGSTFTVRLPMDSQINKGEAHV